MRTLVFVLLLNMMPTATAAEVRVAVAANFRHTADRLATLFRSATGHEVTISSASTGVLYSQIHHGAPFDVFLAADTHSTQKLADTGLGSGTPPKCYARGELTVAGGGVADLENPALSLAIANPQTAPYGKAATEVLSRPQFSAAKQRKLVRASNVVQAYQFLHTGSVDLALVAKSLAPDTGTPVPKDWYTPIEQQALLLNQGRGKAAAEQCFAFLSSDAALTLITDTGYGRCP